MTTRRQFIRCALAGTAAASLCSALRLTAQGREKETPLTATALADNLFFITGAGANVVAARGAEGAVLIDGGTERRSSELLKLATKQTGTKRVTALVNTHWHPEQTGSNLRLGKAGAKIIAHVNTKLWLQRPIRVDWLDKPFGPYPQPAIPTETTYTTGKLQTGSQTIEYGYLGQAHTDGDLYAYFREANVLAGGGVVSGDRWPLLDYQTGGWIGGLVGGIDRLLKVCDDNTRIVPADGPLLTKADLQAQRTMYFTIYDRLVKALTKGLGPGEAADTEPAKDFNPQWGDPRPFVLMAFKSMWGHFAPDA
jgi:glyoxylase-like metal-dependent hydrolase (beta-lactamase superfamily II)